MFDVIRPIRPGRIRNKSGTDGFRRLVLRVFDEEKSAGRVVELLRIYSGARTTIRRIVHEMNGEGSTSFTEGGSSWCGLPTPTLHVWAYGLERDSPVVSDNVVPLRSGSGIVGRSMFLDIPISSICRVASDLHIRFDPFNGLVPNSFRVEVPDGNIWSL